jgi:hypothetical protein
MPLGSLCAGLKAQETALNLLTRQLQKSNLLQHKGMDWTNQSSFTVLKWEADSMNSNFG